MSLLKRREHSMTLTEFLKQNNTSGPARFYMPGHKGRFPLEGGYDITEITGADSLYHADGVIRRTEERFERLYGSRTTVLSAGGSTLCIQGMLAAVRLKYGVRRVLAARNAHISFVHACALLDIDPVWIYPTPNDRFGVSGQVRPQQLEQALQKERDIGAVYITSPDYFGMLSDIKGLAEVCSRHGVPLLVDNAHGAHLRFLPEDRHPMSLGAALCSDSAHKTLPVLTGGALLHASADFSAEELKEAMGLFGSTSPSYLIMQSLDACADYLEQGGKEDFSALCDRLLPLRQLARERGLFVFDSEPAAHFALAGRPAAGGSFSDYLRAHGVEYDYATEDTAVLMPSPFNAPEEFECLAAALGDFVPAPDGWETEPCPVPHPERVCSVREASLARGEVVPIDQSVGRVAAQSKITCPPGVAVVVAGERIDEASKNLLKKSGIQSVKVV